MRERSPSAPAGTDSLRLDQQLCFSLYAAQLAMTRAYRPLLRELGLTYPQYLVLLALWEHDGETVSALGERLCLDSGTLTPLLVRLQEQALVDKRRGVVDGREVFVHLTARGRSLERRAVPVRTAVMDGTGLSPRGIDKLKAQLRALQARLTAAEAASVRGR